MNYPSKAERRAAQKALKLYLRGRVVTPNGAPNRHEMRRRVASTLNREERTALHAVARIETRGDKRVVLSPQTRWKRQREIIEPAMQRAIGAA